MRNNVTDKRRSCWEWQAKLKTKARFSGTVIITSFTLGEMSIHVCLGQRNAWVNNVGEYKPLPVLVREEL